MLIHKLSLCVSLAQVSIMHTGIRTHTLIVSSLHVVSTIQAHHTSTPLPHTHAHTHTYPLTARI